MSAHAAPASGAPGALDRRDALLSITVALGTYKFPRPEYRVRIEWTCDPSRTATLVQRVFEEIEFVKATPFSPQAVALIRQGLVREFENDVSIIRNYMTKELVDDLDLYLYERQGDQ